jgi:hypothetical protein
MADMRMPRLIDELHSPPLRSIIGELLTTAISADIAVSHIRLAAVDLAAGETAGLRRCRVLLARLDAAELASLAVSASHLHTLQAFVAAPHVEIRSAGIGAWAPDFSLYHAARDSVCLIGAHYFHHPLVHGGPSFTCALQDVDAVSTAARRFEELWARGYNVKPAVLAEVELHLRDACAP